MTSELFHYTITYVCKAILAICLHNRGECYLIVCYCTALPDSTLSDITRKLTSGMVGVLTPQKSAKATNQASLLPDTQPTELVVLTFTSTAQLPTPGSPIHQSALGGDCLCMCISPSLTAELRRRRKCVC